MIKNKKLAFTLIEVMISIALMTLIIGGVFSIIASSLDLANETQLEIKQTSLHQNFIQILQQHLQKLPDETNFSLKKREIEGSYFFTLFLKNCGDFLGAGTFLGEYDWVVLESHSTVGGFISLVAFFLSEEEGIAFEKGNKSINEINKIELLNNLKLIDVNFISLEKNPNDTQNEKRYDYWDSQNRKPDFIELKMQTSNDFTEKTNTIWIPNIVKSKLTLPKKKTENEKNK